MWQQKMGLCRPRESYCSFVPFEVSRIEPACDAEPTKKEREKRKMKRRKKEKKKKCERKKEKKKKCERKKEKERKMKEKGGKIKERERKKEREEKGAKKWLDLYNIEMVIFPIFQKCFFPFSIFFLLSFFPKCP